MWNMGAEVRKIKRMKDRGYMCKSEETKALLEIEKCF
jgi:hypothetical protein